MGLYIKYKCIHTSLYRKIKLMKCANLDGPSLNVALTTLINTRTTWRMRNKDQQFYCLVKSVS